MSCWRRGREILYFLYIYFTALSHECECWGRKKIKGHREAEPERIHQEENAKIWRVKDSAAGSRLCIVRRSDWDVLFSGSKDAANSSVIKSCSRQMGPDGAGSRSFRWCYWGGVPKLFHSTDPQIASTGEQDPLFAGQIHSDTTFINKYGLLEFL